MKALTTQDEMVEEFISLTQAAPDDEYRGRLINLFGTVYAHAFNPTFVEHNLIEAEAQAHAETAAELQAEYARHLRCDSLRSMVKIAAGCVGLYKAWEGSMPNPRHLPELITTYLDIPPEHARRIWREASDQRAFQAEWIRHASDKPGLKERTLAATQ